MKASLWVLALTCLSLATFTAAQSPSAAGKRPGAGKTPAMHIVPVAKLTLIKQVPPIYPEQAKKEAIQGSVNLHVSIGVDGAVKKVTVLSGPPALTQAAADAVREWRYKPYLLDGKVVQAETTVIVNFQLTVMEPLPWWAIVTEVAKGTPSSQIVSELQQRPVDFPYNSSLDAFHEKLIRSLGASEEVMEAARRARLYPTQQYSASEEKLLASSENDVRSLIAKSPENAGLHELLAMILTHDPLSHDDATMELRRAVLLNPDSPSAHFYLALSLLGPDTTAQVASEAVYNIRESLRLLPDQFEGHLGLGYALRAEEEWDESITEFQRAIEVAKSPAVRSEVHEEIGDLHLSRKQYDLAADEYREAFHGAIEKAHLHLSLGIALYDQGDYRHALIAFRNYLWLRKDNSTSEVGQNWLAASLYQLGQYSESIAQAHIALEAYPSDSTAKTWLAGATSKLQAQGADGPPSAVVQATAGPAGGGGLAGTTWACTTEFVGSMASYLRTFNAGGRLEDSNVRAPSADTTDTIANSIWQQSGTQLVILDQRSGEPWWRGTVSGNSIIGGSLKHACPECADIVPTGDSTTCTLQSSPAQSTSAANVSQQGSNFTSPSIPSGSSGSNANGPDSSNSASGSGSNAGNPADSDLASAKTQNDPRGSQSDGNDYTDTASQCGHPQIEANTLYIVNQCGFTVDATYTSRGDIWGETPLAPGEHHRTAYSAVAVNNVGGVNVYTCPGSGTAVDPSGTPVAPSPIYTGREYKCHK